jgi:hypothetical protein
MEGLWALEELPNSPTGHLLFQALHSAESQVICGSYRHLDTAQIMHSRCLVYDHGYDLVCVVLEPEQSQGALLLVPLPLFHRAFERVHHGAANLSAGSVARSEGDPNRLGGGLSA